MLGLGRKSTIGAFLLCAIGLTAYDVYQKTQKYYQQWEGLNFEHEHDCFFETLTSLIPISVPKPIPPDEFTVAKSILKNNVVDMGKYVSDYLQCEPQTGWFSELRGNPQKRRSILCVVPAVAKSLYNLRWSEISLLFICPALLLLLSLYLGTRWMHEFISRCVTATARKMFFEQFCSGAEETEKNDELALVKKTSQKLAIEYQPPSSADAEIAATEKISKKRGALKRKDEKKKELGKKKDKVVEPVRTSSSIDSFGGGPLTYDGFLGFDRAPEATSKLEHLQCDSFPGTFEVQGSGSKSKENTQKNTDVSMSKKLQPEGKLSAPKKETIMKQTPHKRPSSLKKKTPKAIKQAIVKKDQQLHNNMPHSTSRKMFFEQKSVEETEKNEAGAIEQCVEKPESSQSEICQRDSSGKTKSLANITQILERSRQKLMFIDEVLESCLQEQKPAKGSNKENISQERDIVLGSCVQEQKAIKGSGNKSKENTTKKTAAVETSSWLRNMLSYTGNKKAADEVQGSCLQEQRSTKGSSNRTKDSISEKTDKENMLLNLSKGEKKQLKSKSESQGQRFGIQRSLQRISEKMVQNAEAAKKKTKTNVTKKKMSKKLKPSDGTFEGCVHTEQSSKKPIARYGIAASLHNRGISYEGRKVSAVWSDKFKEGVITEAGDSFLEKVKPLEIGVVAKSPVIEASKKKKSACKILDAKQDQKFEHAETPRHEDCSRNEPSCTSMLLFLINPRSRKTEEIECEEKITTIDSTPRYGIAASLQNRGITGYYARKTMDKAKSSQNYEKKQRKKKKVPTATLR